MFEVSDTNILHVVHRAFQKILQPTIKSEGKKC